jgi:predicted transcriptional regulator
MDKVNVTVRLEADKVAFLDELAKNFDRDRSYLIKEALDSSIALHRWQIEEIHKGIAEADAGSFVPHDEVERLLAKWTQ